MEYQFEEIESVEQLENFNDEYVYDIEVSDDSHTFIANDILVHNSVYTTFGSLFNAMTPESRAKFSDDDAKLKFILHFNKDFVDKQNNQWCEEIYGPRHGHNIHEFELETVSRAGIYLKKKKYLKALAFSKGKFFKTPKISGTGIEIIKSTTPRLCREILTDLMKSLTFDYNESEKEEYLMYFNEHLNEWKKKFWAAPIEDISQSIGVGDYKKYIIEDKESLEFASKAPVSVKAAARYNYLAYKNGEADKKIYSGKIKYYNICLSMGGTSKEVIDYFGFPAGELPSWAPSIDKKIQWRKTVIEPINRFLEVMNLPLANADGTVQMTLF